MARQINIPRYKIINYVATTILVSLVVVGIFIVKNINREYAIRQLAGKFQEYKYATLAFNNVYSGLPGDLANATFYWKDATTDGNGDRKIDSTTQETITAWQQLQLADLIRSEKTFSGKWAENKEGVFIAGVNIPSAKSTADGYYVTYSEKLLRNVFGIAATNEKAGLPSNPALTPDEAYTLDLMIDDGYPDKGNIVSTHETDSTECFAAGEYKKESEIKECILLFKL